MRLNKFIARFGNFSRREADKLINTGAVYINDKQITTAVAFVGPDDQVKIDPKTATNLPSPNPTYNQKLQNHQTKNHLNSSQEFQIRLWIYHKTKGTITSYRDQFGRPTIFERLPQNLPKVVSVGRLDFNTEGLLLLTNYGPLAHLLELPKNGFPRVYKCRYHGKISDIQILEAAKGPYINGVQYSGAIITRDDNSKQSEKKTNSWLTITLREGKNREIRRIMHYFGLEVTRLIRIKFDQFELGKLEPGMVTEIPASKITKYLNMMSLQ